MRRFVVSLNEDNDNLNRLDRHLGQLFRLRDLKFDRFLAQARDQFLKVVGKALDAFS